MIEIQNHLGSTINQNTRYYPQVHSHPGYIHGMWMENIHNIQTPFTFPSMTTFRLLKDLTSEKDFEHLVVLFSNLISI